MSLKIIGAGYGRTGTLSTYTALNSLGFPCYHMFEVIENKENKTYLDFWNKVAIARYNEHIEEVKAIVPRDKLLIFSVDQGWEPLCNFLGVQVPEADFPTSTIELRLKKPLLI